MFQSLRTRFLGLLLLGVTLAILAIAVLFFQYRTQIAQTERLGQAAAIASTLDQLFASVLQASNTSRRFVLSGDPLQLEAYNQSVANIPDQLDTLSKLTEDHAAFAGELNRLEARLAHKLAHLDEILELNKDRQGNQMRVLLVGGDGLERLEAVRDAIGAFRGVGYTLADAQREQLRISVLVQVAVVFLMLLCGIAWAAILGNEAIRNILIPISSMNAHVQRIATGDFRDMLPVGRRDEIGGLAEQINHMTTQLRTARDEREQAQAELAAERENLIDAIEALEEGFAAYDSEGRLMRCNQTFLDYYPALVPLITPGVTYETLLRHKAKSGSEPIALGREEAFVAERLAAFASNNTVRQCVLSDGRVLQRSSYRTGQGGHVAVYVDMTEIKRAEADLRKLNRELDARVKARTDDLNAANAQLQLLNAELATIIGSAPVAVVALSPNRDVTTWNAAAIELTGLEISEVAPGLVNTVAPSDLSDLNAFLDNVYAGENQVNTELQMRHKDGHKIEANLSASALSDTMGRPLGAILIIADLTEARALQRQFHQSQKMEVVAKLTAGLAHDFNNLLAIVISNIEMLEGRIPDTGGAHDMLDAAKRAGLSGVALNKKLLTFAREQALELEGLDLAKEFTFLEALLHTTLGEGIELEVTLGEDLWPVLADRSLWQSAVLNLAVNARDAMDGEGRFRIRAQNSMFDTQTSGHPQVGACVEIIFSDTGKGMNQEVIDQAFQPFFTTKDFGKSSGLGLSMVYGFVKQSGGDIKISSTLDQGTDITISLPRTARGVEPRGNIPVKSEKSKGHNETILVVEDNTEMRRVLVLQLAELGFAPIQAESGTTALELLDAEVPVDLMLTDIVMPGGIDGRELAKRARNIRPNLPVVFLSGYPAVKEDGQDMSWEGFGTKVLAKPVSQADLGERINQSLSAGRGPRPA